MFGIPPRSDAVKLVPADRDRPAAPPVPDFDLLTPNRPPSPAGEGPAAVPHFRWGDDGEPVSLRSAQDTPLPDTPLQWSLLLSPPTAAPEPALCPGCGGPLTVAGKSWCLRCGYNSDQPQRVLAPAARGGVARAAVVLAFATLGCLAVVAATAYRKDLVPDRTDLRVWWIGFEGLAGFLLYCVGHAAAVALTVRHWPDDKPSVFDPLSVWRYALYHLPGTRWAVTLGLWGATAFLCAFVLFWLNDFALKDKTAKPPIRAARHAPESHGSGSGDQAAGESESGAAGHPKQADEQPAEGYRSGESAGGGDKRPAGRREVNEIDPSLADAPRLRPRSQTGTAVVIGYVPDKTNPGRVERVLLGSRGPDGVIRFAGVAQVDKAFEEAGGVSRLRALPRPAATPGYALSKEVVPVEPKLLADIKFVEQDTRGIYKDTVVTGVESDRPKQ